MTASMTALRGRPSALSRLSPKARSLRSARLGLGASAWHVDEPDHILDAVVADQPERFADDEHRYPLFKRMIKPGVDHLFFLGLAQSSPTIVNLAEQQSKLLAKLLDGSPARTPARPTGKGG